MRQIKWIESNTPASMVDILMASGQMLGHRDVPYYGARGLYGVQWLGQYGTSYNECVNSRIAQYCDPIPEGDPAKQICIDDTKNRCGQLFRPLSQTDIYAIQDEINASLKSQGLCPISRDGKLGPETCGAANYVGVLVPPACQYVPEVPFSPKQCPAGGGGGGGGGGAAPIPAPTPAPAPTTKVGTSTWAVAILAGLVLVGGVVAISQMR